MRPHNSPVPVLALAFCVPALAGAQPTTTRVSVSTGGAEGDGQSRFPAVSDNGRWVAFDSAAANLVPGDTNGVRDVFLRDRQTGLTSRISVGLSGVQGNGMSVGAAITADGRFVLFSSYASNLVVNDTNNRADVFRYEREAGTIVRVSVGSSGSEGNDDSFRPAVSGDGALVTFESDASNLVADDTNAAWDIFLRDVQTGTTTRMSVDSSGVQGNSSSFSAAISGEGRWIAFHSNSGNLVDGDTNNAPHVFVRDRLTGTTSRVSVGPGAVQGNRESWFPSISADGRLVGFESWASNLVAGDTNNVNDIFVHDRQTGTTNRVSVGTGAVQSNGQSGNRSSISADGRWVTFDSLATNLVTGDTNGRRDAFLHDRQTGITTRISVGTGGFEGNGHSWFPVISGDARFVVFDSEATNLVSDDTNGTWDAFLRDLGDDTTPTGLRAHSVLGNLVTLRWIEPRGGIPSGGYVLEGGVNPGEVLASLPTGSTDPAFTFTAPTGSFYVHVLALNGAVRSTASNEIRIHVNVPVPPSAPASLLGLVDGSTLTLAWINTYAGGAPTSLILEVSGSIVASLPLGLADSFAFSGVPPGTYTLSARAQNAAGTSPPSNAVTLSFPGPCSGPPQTPSDMAAYRVGNTVFVDWAPATSGPAPTGYVLNVTGAFVASFPIAARALSGTVSPGAYTLSVVATNTCGASVATPTQTVVVP